MSKHDSIEFAGSCDVAQSLFAGTETIETLLGSGLSGFILSYSYVHIYHASSRKEPPGGRIYIFMRPFVKCVKWW